MPGVIDDLWDRVDVGRAATLEILAAYQSLGIIDDMFLHMRGLPFATAF